MNSAAFFLIEVISRNLDRISVAVCVVTFAVFWFRGANRGTERLDVILPKVFSAGAIPSGVILVVCAFRPDWLSSIEGLGKYIAVSGLVLIHVCYETIRGRRHGA